MKNATFTEHPLPIRETDILTTVQPRTISRLTDTTFLLRSSEERMRAEDIHYRVYDQQGFGLFRTSFFTLNPAYIRDTIIGWHITVPPIHILWHADYVAVCRHGYRRLDTRAMRRNQFGIPMLTKSFLKELEQPEVALSQNGLVAYEINGQAGILVSAVAQEVKI